MENRDLVEHYPREYEVTQFEKIVVAAKRAKDINTRRRAPLVPDRKPAYQALQELNEGLLEIVYKEEEPVDDLALADDSDDDDE